LRDARTIIGDVGLRPSSSNSEDIEITYHFASNHWGQGYATEAAQAVVNYGTELLGLPRILANVPTDHHAAARVVEKLGFAKGSPVGVTGSKHLEYLYEAVLEPEVWEPESGF